MNLYHCPRCTQDYWMGDGAQQLPMPVLNCPFCQEDVNRENAGLPPMDQVVDAEWAATDAKLNQLWGTV